MKRNSPNGLHTHISRVHKMTAAWYYQQHPDALISRIIDNTAEVQIVSGMTPCWEWRGALHPSGYARMRVAGSNTESAHRHSLASKLGHYNFEMARHRCDNPSCVNPGHLLPGTGGQNVEDRDERGRTAVGNRTRLGAFTDEQAYDIRVRATHPWESYQTLASEYGVSELTIRRVVLGETYRHVPSYEPDPDEILW